MEIRLTHSRYSTNRTRPILLLLSLLPLSFLPYERCLQGNRRNYFKKRAEGLGGSRWWLGQLGGRGRLLRPFKELRGPECLPIPESSRAGPADKFILRGQEGNISSVREQGQCWLWLSAFLGGPEKVPAL
jgi:hypothetical protein